MSDERQEVSPEHMEEVRAILGADAEAFQRSNLGKYIFGCIANEEEQLIEELIAADPEDAKEQRRIRNEIYKRATFRLFINEAIQSGDVARQNLQQMEQSQKDY